MFYSLSDITTVDASCRVSQHRGHSMRGPCSCACGMPGHLPRKRLFENVNFTSNDTNKDAESTHTATCREPASRPPSSALQPDKGRAPNEKKPHKCVCSTSHTCRLYSGCNSLSSILADHCLLFQFCLEASDVLLQIMRALYSTVCTQCRVEEFSREIRTTPSTLALVTFSITSTAEARTLPVHRGLS